MRVLLPAFAVTVVAVCHASLWHKCSWAYDAKTIGLGVIGALSFIVAAMQMRPRHVTRLVCMMSGTAVAVAGAALWHSDYGWYRGRPVDLRDHFESYIPWILVGAVSGLVAAYTWFGDRVRLFLLWADQNPRRWIAFGFSAITFGAVSVYSMALDSVQGLVLEARYLSRLAVPWLPKWLFAAAFEAPIVVGAVLALPMVLVVSVVGSNEGDEAPERDQHRARRFEGEY